MTSELKPCPFCGRTPDINHASTFQSVETSKYGAVICCCNGPEVRTSYKDIDHWKQDAIDAWNERIEVQSLTEACREAEAIHLSRRSVPHGDIYDLGPVYSQQSEIDRWRIKELEDASVRLVAACESKQNRIVDLVAALDDLLGCGELPCRIVNHESKDQHEVGEDCPVLERYRLLSRRK